MTFVAFAICLVGCILVARTLPWFVARPFLHIPADAERDRKLDPRRNMIVAGAGLGLVLLAYLLLLAVGTHRNNTALDIAIAGSLYMGWGLYYSLTSAFGQRLNDRLRPPTPQGDPDPWKIGYAYQMAAAQTIVAVYVSGLIVLVVGLLPQAAA